MGTVLTLISNHPILSSLGIILSIVAAWGMGYLRGYRHGEEREAEYQQSRRESLIKNHSKQVDGILDERDVWRKRAARLEDQLIAGAHLRAVPPLASAQPPSDHQFDPLPVNLPPPLNHKGDIS